VLIVAVYLPLLGLALAWSGFQGTLGGWIGPASGVPTDVLLGVAAGLGVVVLTAVLVAVSRRFERLAELMARLTGPMSWPVIALAAAASSVAEEAFFRGAVQGSFGLVAASLVFALCHAVPDRRYLPWTAFALVAGLGLGGLFLWRGSLVAPVLAHFTINLVNLRLLSRRAARAR